MMRFMFRSKVRIGKTSPLRKRTAPPAARTSGIAAAIAVYSRTEFKIRVSQLLRRRMPQDAAQTAHQLFAVLREFDQQGVKLIWIETPPDGIEWDAVRDRLQRAAADPGGTCENLEEKHETSNR